MVKTQMQMSDLRNKAEKVSSFWTESEEYAKEQPSLGKIKMLMKTTFVGRRKWILTDMPQVHTVLEVFPALRTSNRVCFECN